MFVFVGWSKKKKFFSHHSKCNGSEKLGKVNGTQQRFDVLKENYRLSDFPQLKRKIDI